MAPDEQRKRYLVRVYTANGGQDVQGLVDALVETLKTRCPSEGTVEIVDVLEEPEKAIARKIFATPAVVKEMPEPMRRVIGDISDPHKVLMLLGLFSIECP